MVCDVHVFWLVQDSFYARQLRPRQTWLGRVAVLFLGFALGVAATVVYVWRAGSMTVVSSTPPLPHDPPVRVTMGEPFLTAIVRRAMDDATLPTTVDGIRVETHDDAIVVTGVATTFGQPAVAVVTLRPVLRDGHLRFDVVSAELADLPVPIEALIEEEVDTRLRAWLADLPVSITGVDVDPDRGLTVTFQVDLEAR